MLSYIIYLHYVIKFTFYNLKITATNRCAEKFSVFIVS
nr:MAG TPA: hypothetical protein [Caudoviricetes sp.]